MSEQVYDLKAAADYLGYTHQYVRMLIRDEKLEAEKVPIAPGAEVWKYVITSSAIEKFQNTVFSKSGRDDSRTKWVVYGTFIEMEKVIHLLEKAGLHEVADTLRPWNKLKNMPEWVRERLDGQVET
jgi:hypothetical protein